VWWLITVISATQEVEIRRVMFKVNLDKKLDLISTKQTGSGGM
jgi:hypothetical protein